MILAPLSAAALYAQMLPTLKLGFEFLKRSDLATLPDGQHDIDGSRVFALIARGLGRGRDASPLEFHRRYLDIQYVVSGEEVIGWLPIPQCCSVKTEYLPEHDIGFFLDPPASWIAVSPGHFAVFFPEDAHAPLGGDGHLHKVVIKVAMEPA